jgi:hypothetical protein
MSASKENLDRSSSMLSFKSLPATPEVDDSWLIADFTATPTHNITTRPVPVQVPCAPAAGAGVMPDCEYMDELFSPSNKRLRTDVMVAAPTGPEPASAKEVFPNLEEQDLAILEAALAPVDPEEIKALMRGNNYKELFNILQDRYHEQPWYTDILADACVRYIDVLVDNTEIAHVAGIGLGVLAQKHTAEGMLSVHNITRHMKLNEAYKVNTGAYRQEVVGGRTRFVDTEAERRQAKAETARA